MSGFRRRQPRWLRQRSNGGERGWTPHPPNRKCPPHLFIDKKTRDGYDENGNKVIYHFQVCDTCGADNVDIEYVIDNGRKGPQK